MIDLSTLEHARTPLPVARYLLSTYGDRFTLDPFSSEEANRKTGIAEYIRTQFDKPFKADLQKSESIYLFPPDRKYIQEYIDMFYRVTPIKTLIISIPSIVVDPILQNTLLTNSMIFVIIPHMLGLFSEYESQPILYMGKALESHWNIYVMTKRMEVIDKFQNKTPSEYRTFLNNRVGKIEEQAFNKYYYKRKG